MANENAALSSELTPDFSASSLPYKQVSNLEHRGIITSKTALSSRQDAKISFTRDISGRRNSATQYCIAGLNGFQTAFTHITTSFMSFYVEGNITAVERVV